MIFQEQAKPPIDEPTGDDERQGGARIPQAPAPAALAFDYMDEELEEVIIVSEPAIMAPQATFDSPERAGRD